MARQYFEVLNEAESKTATVLIYGNIGGYYYDEETERWKKYDGRSISKTFTDLEKQGCERVNIRINSRGGIIDEGNAIINLMKASKMEIHTYNDGLCASMAFPIWACVPLEMRHAAKNSLFMLHSPLMWAYGNAKDMRDGADVLDKYSTSVQSIICEACEMDEKEVNDTFFDYEDHWLTYDEAASYGFVDKDDPENNIKAEAVAKIEDLQAAMQKDILQMGAQKGTEMLEQNSARIAALATDITNHIKSQKEEKMDKVNLLESLKKGEISREDVQAALDATQPQEEKTSEEINNLKSTVDNLSTQITALTEKLNSNPAAASTTTATPATEVEDDELDVFNKQIQATAATGTTRIFEK